MRKLLAIALLFASATNAETHQAQVTRVVDGDTIEVQHHGKRETVRIQGIDAPEQKQPHGNTSRRSLEDLLNGKTVTIESHKKDKYGRTIGKVTVNGQDAGLAQIESGQARHYKKYQNEQSKADRTKYSKAEKRARATRKGEWQNGRHQSPENYRKRKK